MKWLRYPIEALLTLLAYALLRALPYKAASALGSKVATAVGPKTKVHRVADYNLKRALPHLSEDERAELLHRMWDNLGRVFCEYPHLSGRKLCQCIESVEGVEHLEALKTSPQPCLLISGHFGNWELLPVAAHMHGVPLHLLYRPANNLIVDSLLGYMRRAYSLGLYAKGMDSARALIRAIKRREPIAMLVDQKTNDGIAVPFFGDEAMTTDAVAHFVKKYQVTILPARCVRIEKTRFRMVVDAPMTFERTADETQDTALIMQQINTHLEQWIKEDPAQWFWVHKRWPHSKAFAKGEMP